MKTFNKMDPLDLEGAQEERMSQGDYAHMTELVEQLKSLRAKHAELQAQAAQIHDQMYTLARETIPTQAKAIGQTLYKMTDGSTVEIVKRIEAKVAKKNEDRVFAILENELNAGSIIKNDVTIPFDRTEQDQRKLMSLTSLLSAQGVDYEVKKSLHAASLKKFVNECLENGVQLDHKLFGIFEVQDTVINGDKTPKK